MRPLLIGKCSIEFYDTLQEMMHRGILNAPTYLPIPYTNPSTELNHPVFDYIVKGIR